MAAIWVWKISSKTVTYFPDDKDDKQDIRVLNELENIDDELDKEGIVIVRLDNDAEAKEYGIDHLPTLVYFENKIPAIYEGTLKLTLTFKNITWLWIFVSRCKSTILYFQRPITAVRRRRAWIVPGWLTIKESDHVRLTFRPNPDWVWWMWVASWKSGEWRVRPPSS